MRKHYTQLTITLCLLLGVSSAVGRTRPSTTTTPRSQYSPMAAAQAQGHVRQQPDTWYDFLLKRFNPTNFDYGKWLEERRRAFLVATVKNPYFQYSLWLTLGSLLLMAAYAKLWFDHRRERYLTEEMMTDLYNHDAYSRAAAREAIERYNQHIEHCNRIIEAKESGRPTSWTGSDAGEPSTKLQQLADQLTAMTQERDTLRGELGEKTNVVADMSLRMEALSRKTNDKGEPRDAAAVQTGSNAEQSDSARLMNHINNLQQQLYAERQKNKRLKGA
jgi:hypothetical protein